jgi:hypothetical protein
MGGDLAHSGGRRGVPYRLGAAARQPKAGGGRRTAPIRPAFFDPGGTEVAAPLEYTVRLEPGRVGLHVEVNARDHRGTCLGVAYSVVTVR